MDLCYCHVLCACVCVCVCLCVCVCVCVCLFHNLAKGMCTAYVSQQAHLSCTHYWACQAIPLHWILCFLVTSKYITVSRGRWYEGKRELNVLTIFKTQQALRSEITHCSTCPVVVQYWKTPLAQTILQEPLEEFNKLPKCILVWCPCISWVLELQ